MEVTTTVLGERHSIQRLSLFVGASEFNKVSVRECKEIWDTLETTYEGTNQVKESKIGLLPHDFELFRIREGESINEMFERFTNIVRGLKALGKDFPNA
ncbi:Uncharacterized protein TCM_033346 [Theobroma cacao]|uniref:Uncharacterized protein n=1 Tax=Theobroma cacao TaxID=3641 RepID=A0A061F9S3_THECC|nr:Uncharacterized protein TCM_033346 [Theobroma cacao]